LKRETDGSHIHVLENNAVEIEGYTFVGCTLWTDFLLSPDAATAMRDAERIMSDFNLIRFGSGKRALRALDTARIHSASVEWLGVTLAKCNRARTLVGTHYAPSSLSEAPWHVNGTLSPAFVSALDPLVESSSVPLWIHGHTHFNVDYTLGSTRVLSNQRGYPDQPCEGFNPGLVVEI
jgi:hypothetical protein